MDYKIYNDYELVSMVQENNDDYSDVLYYKYYPIIYSISKEFYTHYCNYGWDYDDFVQEALLSFQKAINTYDETKNILFYTYMNLCIRRGLTSFCRNISCNSKNTPSYNLLDIDDFQLSDVGSDLYNLFERQELNSLFRNAIGNLSFEDGCILELKLNGFSYKEISTLLDIPFNTIEYRTRKGKKVLKEVFNDYLCK